MRFEALAVLALAGCTFFDANLPIGIVADELDAEDRANLEEAAACWNLEFGTRFVVGDDASSAAQQVEAFYDEQTCLHTVAQVQPGWPGRIAICPHYPQLLDAKGFDPPSRAFRVLSHELGHVLNIDGHPDDSAAVMQGGGYGFEPMFTRVDRRLFFDANPDFTGSAPCRRVVRLPLLGSDQRITHCTCDTGRLFDRLFDLSRPIAIVPASALEPDRAPLSIAADCWNLHYGLALVVRAPRPGDQVAHLERVSAECPFYGRIQDGDVARGCTPLMIEDRHYRSMHGVAAVLGVNYSKLSEGEFGAYEDEEFARVYPGHPVACRDVRRDSTTGACTCHDAPPDLVGHAETQGAEPEPPDGVAPRAAGRAPARAPPRARLAAP